MRFLAIAVAGLCSIVPAVASAESGEEFRARGEQLAKDGRFTEAIDAFKAAERIEPRARHACLIALAYTRRELWPQAEIWLEQCETRATPSDPLPEWVPMAKQQLAERLAAVNVAAVKLEILPAGVDVKLAVSSFAPDEVFSPRTIHLPPGNHVITATAANYNDAQKTIVVTDKSPQTVTITMLPVEDKKIIGGGGGGGVVVGPQPPASKVPVALMGIGGGLVLAGAGLHVFWFKPARDRLAEANTRPQYNAIDETGLFEKRRNITIAVYGIGAATLLTGVILKFTVFKQKEAPVQVSVTPHEGGGLVNVGWSR